MQGVLLSRTVVYSFILCASIQIQEQNVTKKQFEMRPTLIETMDIILKDQLKVIKTQQRPQKFLNNQLF